MKRRTISIDQSLSDPKLLGAALGDSAPWTNWLIILRAAFGLPLNDTQRQSFMRVAGGRSPPIQRVRECGA
jgi:hypothetical protein